MMRFKSILGIFSFLIAFDARSVESDSAVVLGQGATTHSVEFNVCKAGQVFRTENFATIDHFSKKISRDPKPVCSPDTCVYRPNDGRPYIVAHRFDLIHRSGIESLIQPQWATNELDGLFKKNPGVFADACGRSYVNTIDRGGSLEVEVTASFATEAERLIFLQETQFDLANLRTAGTMISNARGSNGVLRIGWRQIAGDPASAGSILTSGSYLICQIRDAAGCSQTLASILSYGLGKWIDDLNSIWLSDSTMLRSMAFTVVPY